MAAQGTRGDSEKSRGDTGCQKHPAPRDYAAILTWAAWFQSKVAAFVKVLISSFIFHQQNVSVMAARSFPGLLVTNTLYVAPPLCP